MQARMDVRELEVVLVDFERRGRAATKLLPEIGEALIAAVSDVYEAEGPGWEPLSAATLKKRRGTSAKILQDSGVMSGSTHKTVGGTWVEAFAGVDYAEFHARGTSRMPQRNPFDLGPFEGPMLDEVSEMVARELVGA